MQPVFGPYNIFEPGTAESSARRCLLQLTFLVVNQLLVSTVVAFDSGQRVTAGLRGRPRFQAMTAGVLAILAPVAASSCRQQPLMLPMLIAPVARRLQQCARWPWHGTPGQP